MGLGIRGWRQVGLGICKVGGVGSRSNHAPWILCSAVSTISSFMTHQHNDFLRELRDLHRNVSCIPMKCMIFF